MIDAIDYEVYAALVRTHVELVPHVLKNELTRAK
jgi:hypothetical protein